MLKRPRLIVGDHAGIVALTMLSCAVMVPSVQAQSTAQIPLQFDFMNPGARSLALGGAFTGAADDATAAFNNPGGLGFLHRIELSGEARFRRTETPFLEGGRLSGLPTGFGMDTVDGPSYGTDVDTHGAPAFFSVLLPAGPVTIAGYYTQVATMRNAFASAGTFQLLDLGGFSTQFREIPMGGTRNITVRNYGGSVGLRLGKSVSVGAGLSVYVFRLESRFARSGLSGEWYSAPDSGIVSATADQDGSDVAMAPNVGVLWAVAPSIRVGGHFRRGPRFGFIQRDRVPTSGLDLSREGEFKVPDVAGVGIEWRPGENVRVLGDYARIQYSQLKQDFVDIQSVASGRQDRLHVDDANEWHGGVEYFLLELAWPLAIRAGAWLDPDHSVRYEATSASDAVDAILLAALPERKDVLHYTFGVGVVPHQRFELNVAADLSSRATYLTASVVARF